MAGLYTCHSPRRNSSPGDEGELTGGLPGAHTEGSNTPTSSPAGFWALTPASPSINKLFKRFMKTYLIEYNQRSNQPPKECKQLFKAKILDVYYGKLHIDCYYFCQQCEDPLRILGSPEPTKPPLQHSFFMGTSAYDGSCSSIVEVRK